MTTDEEITREVYIEQMEEPIARCLRSRQLIEQVLYMVTTLGVPLKVAGSGEMLSTTAAAVDSELAVLYRS